MSVTTEIYSLGLPQGVRRHHLMDLVERLARSLHLTHTAVLYLRALARTTKHADWSEQGRGPVCFVRQRDISEEIGIDRRSANRIEARLEAVGLLKILRLDNGHRSGQTGRSGATGVFLAPLIDRFAELAALREEMEERQRARKAARARASVARSELRRAIRTAAEDDAPKALLDAAQAALDTEPTRLSTIDDVEELRAIADRLKAALHHLSEGAGNCSAEPAEIVDSLPSETKMSLACDAGVPHHIHNTSNQKNVKCIERTAVPAEIGLLDPNKSGSWRLEAKPVERTAPGKPEDREIVEEEETFERSDGAKMPPTVLYRAAGQDFRMYVDGRSGDHGVSYSDIIFAADIRRRELRIRDAAWNAAGDALGYVDRAAAILVLDRNADHPTYPVKNPGGALIGMVKKARAGELRLTSSIIGILERTRGDGA